MEGIDFSLNVFPEFAEFIAKKIITKELLKPVTSCLKDEHVPTEPIRHR